MKEERNYKIFIKDILTSIEKTEQFIAGIDYNTFVNDDKTVSAIIRKLEIIGEAVKNMPLSLKEEYPQVKWKSMAGMRDKLIHEYFAVDHEILWKVIKEELPEVKPLIKNILEKMNI